MSSVNFIGLLGGAVVAALAMAYSLTAWIAVRMRTRVPAPGSPGMPPVTILKPLCGAEHELYDYLRSFCDQAYPKFQIVFGVSEADDAAISVVRKLQHEFPSSDLAIAIDRRQHGSNRKVSNLINMMPLARHDYLVIADSDVRVTRDYLAKIVVPLLDPGVGIVTCPYLGCPRPGLWSLLGSLFINDWFMPSVRVAALFGSRSFAFGATIAMRRNVLMGIGGFQSIANQLADDYRLGELTRQEGLRTILSEVRVETYVDERSFGDLIQHKLRWLRTIRSVRPVGYSLSFITFGVPVAALGTLLAGGSRATLAMLAVTGIARVMLHVAGQRSRLALSHLLVLPLSDVLGITLWGWSFVTRRVHWRQVRYSVARDGAVQPVT